MVRNFVRIWRRSCSSDNTLSTEEYWQGCEEEESDEGGGGRGSCRGSGCTGGWTMTMMEYHLTPGITA